MSSMAKITPLLRRAIKSGTSPNVALWAAAYEHLPGTDVTAAAILSAIAEIEAEELLKARPEAEVE